MNIKRFTLLSMTAILAVSCFSFFSLSKKAKYVPLSEQSHVASSANGYLDYLNMIKSNQITGEINYDEVMAGINQANKLPKSKASLGLNWRFKGPDNIGGRTRAFIIDRNNKNHLLTAGVAGGVFESFDAGQTWNEYDLTYSVKNVSCITQAIDGSFYIGTGGHFERGGAGDRGYFFVGTGVHKLTGNGGFESIIAPNSRISGNIPWATVGQLEADPNDANIIYAAMNTGVRKIDLSTNPPTISDPIGLTRQANDVDVTPNGKVIVSYSGGELYVSHDNGQRFFNHRFTGANRMEIAIAPSNEDIMYASMAAGSGCLFGIFRSANGGASWDRISPSSSLSFDMFGSNCQGFWDNAISVAPDDPGMVVVGGVTLYRWIQSSVDPAKPNGSWNQIDVTFNGLPGQPRNSSYVHADKHRVTFDRSDANTVYIATDGGIFKSTDFKQTTPTYREFNFNYKVAQYYDIAAGPNDIVLGGTQDNGSHAIGLEFNNNLGAFRVLTGDGFDAEMSVINPSIGFASSQFNGIARIQGIGTSTGNSNFSQADIVSANTYLSGQCGTGRCSPVFYSTTKLWESFKHEGSQDIVDVAITEKTLPPMTPGRVIPYTSNNSNLSRSIKFQYTVNATVPYDTSKVNDNRPDVNYSLNDDSTLWILAPTDTLFVGNASTEKTVILSDPNTSLSQVFNFDTLVVDTTSLTVTVRRPNDSISNFSYTYGTPINYWNQYLDNASEPGLNGIASFELNKNGSEISLSAVNVQIDFYYGLKFIDSAQTIYASANWPGRDRTNPNDASQRHVFMSRDLLKNTPNIKWYCIAGPQSVPHSLAAGEDVLTMEFTSDGNTVFLGTRNGNIYRVTNLDRITNDLPASTSANLFNIQSDANLLDCRRIASFSGRAVTGIDIFPNDPNYVAVSLGNYGNRNFVAVIESAMTDPVTVRNIQGIGTSRLPEVPAYDVLFDKNDNSVPPSKLLVGNELGLFATENPFETTVSSDTTITPADTVIRTMDTVSFITGNHIVQDSIVYPQDSLVFSDTTIYFQREVRYIVQLINPDTTIIPESRIINIGPDVKWTEESNGMGRVPVFSLDQMRFGWQYAINPDKIYAGTHGRGIFEADNFVGLDDVEKEASYATFASSLDFYPNPASSQAFAEFYLPQNDNVQMEIYDIRGKLIRQNSNSLSKGRNKVEFNFDDLNNGTYIIRFIANGKVATKKFVLYH